MKPLIKGAKGQRREVAIFGIKGYQIEHKVPFLGLPRLDLALKRAKRASKADRTLACTG